jgi:hypothetical protein
MARIGGLFAALALVLLLAHLAEPSAARPSFAYHWPVKPFDRQHPIRGAFGDPRTLVTDRPFGVTRPHDRGQYSFHSGVDIAAAPGTPVYPVTDGHVVLVGRHAIVIDSSNKRQFYYWHLHDNVVLGQQVVAGQTVLGWVRRPFDHVHFGEVDDHHGVNPLARGHLEPYVDHTTPRILGLYVDDGGAPRRTDGGLLGPDTTLAIAAADEPAMPVPGPFAGLPQTPALVEWRLRIGEKWKAWHVAANFRHTEPVSTDFWKVYAAGTYQNAPLFERRVYTGIAGLYLFRVRLDTSRLAPGQYELEARVADVRGNYSTTVWPLIQAARGGHSRPARRAATP